MIVTFDDSKNMYIETLRVFEDHKSLPKCKHCGSRLGYDKSINYISCPGTLSNGQRCLSRHGNDYKENGWFDSLEDVEILKTFSKYCQSLKPFIVSHEHYKLNATIPIKLMNSLKYSWGTDKAYRMLEQFCEKNHLDNIPYLSEEVSIKLRYPNISNEELNTRLYEKTNDIGFLPNDLREMFII